MVSPRLNFGANADRATGEEREKYADFGKLALGLRGRYSDERNIRARLTRTTTQQQGPTTNHLFPHPPPLAHTRTRQIFDLTQNNYYTQESSYITYYLLYAMGTIVLLGGILVPKLYHIFAEKRNERASTASSGSQRQSHPLDRGSLTRNLVGQLSSALSITTTRDYTTRRGTPKEAGGASNFTRKAGLGAEIVGEDGEVASTPGRTSPFVLTENSGQGFSRSGSEVFLDCSDSDVLSEKGKGKA